MQEAVSTVAPGRRTSRGLLVSQVRAAAPTLIDCCGALASSILLIICFPDFALWPVAWVSLTPLLIVVARKPAPFKAFLLGWITGSLFFYGSCYWLTYSMIHFGRLAPWLSYALLVPGALVMGLFPASSSLILAFALRRWQNKALFLAPFIWTALEWARLEITGQLWNAIGYSQAYHPMLIQAARWGGVYAVGFLILVVNAATAFVILNRCKRAFVTSLAAILAVASIICAAYVSSPSRFTPDSGSSLSVVAVQPNVPMDRISDVELQQLMSLHMSESEKALRQLPAGTPRLVIWPESPMTFAYGSDPQLRELLARFTQENHTALVFNSQEPAPAKGLYNSAILVNEEGRQIAQYDKIRLLPFGEYVPVPRSLPGASLITAIVGDFAAGDKYTLFSIGPVRAGVFICIESAYPSIARTFTAEGADVLINISNDGYLGPTAVMRQHLANAIFRAVENGRPLLRVTNTGITAYITASGEVHDESGSFQTAVRIWNITNSDGHKTFYTKHGNLFVVISAILTGLIFSLALRRNGKEV